MMTCWPIGVAMKQVVTNESEALMVDLDEALICGAAPARHESRRLQPLNRRRDGRTTTVRLFDLSPIEWALLKAGAGEQRWRCEHAESDHSQCRGNEIPCDVGL